VPLKPCGLSVAGNLFGRATLHNNARLLDVPYRRGHIPHVWACHRRECVPHRLRVAGAGILCKSRGGSDQS
jgi:hypothetical protein